QQKGIDIEAAARELLAEKQPSLQFVTPEQLGGAAVFLASDAAAQMTGTTMSLDGGWTARCSRRIWYVYGRRAPARRPFLKEG
ncbi:MAG: SDR family oxidoreductase, partial [Alcaligenes sp.]